MNKLIATLIFLIFSSHSYSADSGNELIDSCRRKLEAQSFQDLSCTEPLLNVEDFTAQEKGWIYYTRGYAYFHGYADYKKAIEEYTKAIDMNGTEQIIFSSHINRGYSFYHLGDLTSAYTDYESAIRIWPNHKTANELKEDIAHAQRNE